jgi:hypothetical protein
VQLMSSVLAQTLPSQTWKVGLIGERAGAALAAVFSAVSCRCGRGS